MQHILIEQFPPIVSGENGEGAKQPLVYSKEHPASLEEILTNTGFRNIKVYNETAEFVSADEETWWQQIRSVGWWRFFEKLNADQLPGFKQDVFNALQAKKH